MPHWRRPTNIVELQGEWRKEAPLWAEDQFPAIEDMPAQPEDVFFERLSAGQELYLRCDQQSATLAWNAQQERPQIFFHQGADETALSTHEKHVLDKSSIDDLLQS